MRLDTQTQWEDWIRQGGWTRGEGFHRRQERHPPGMFMQVEVPFTSNGLFKLAVDPHAEYVSFQEYLRYMYEVKLRLRSLLSSSVGECRDL